MDEKNERSTMLSNIWVYKKTSKVMISLLLAAVLVLATQNWLLGLLMFIVTAAAVVWVKRSDPVSYTHLTLPTIA